MKKRNLNFILSVSILIASFVMLIGTIAYSQPGPAAKDSGIVAIDTITTNAPYPDLFTKELPTTTGGTIGTILYATAGFLIWFVFEWRKKKKRDPSTTFIFSVWIKDNGWNIVFFFIGLIILKWQAGAMHPVSAIMIGLAPNALIDWVMKEFQS